ncbi:hypothetical protein [Mucilaginibacter sp. CSA2-8R]|uniref:hypothetical protein n=1 Tax=Mucilaginibacter sp. CSA2-8R TaxID=3141542 RepID=UPI00315DFF6F
MVTAATTAFIIILPLNYIRNRIDLFVNRTAYNDAVALAVNGRLKKINNLYELPHKYAKLSVSDGKIYLLNKPGLRAAMFYTFTGIPDGQMGFVYVQQGKPNDAISELFSLVDKKVDLGDGWFYVAGE